jgi:hypothetical protein
MTQRYDHPDHGQQALSHDVNTAPDRLSRPAIFWQFANIKRRSPAGGLISATDDARASGANDGAHTRSANAIGHWRQNPRANLAVTVTVP